MTRKGGEVGPNIHEQHWWLESIMKPCCQEDETGQRYCWSVVRSVPMPSVHERRTIRITPLKCAMHAHFIPRYSWEAPRPGLKQHNNVVNENVRCYAPIMQTSVFMERCAWIWARSVFRRTVGGHGTVSKTGHGTTILISSALGFASQLLWV